MRMKCTRTRYTVAVSLFACRHDLVALTRSRSSRTSSKMTFHGRGDEDCVQNGCADDFRSRMTRPVPIEEFHKAENGE
jgi:hypothetical protein